MTAITLLALLFAFATGVLDAARTISPVVSSGAMRPQHAVLLAAACNLGALALFDLDVARFVATALIDPLHADRALVVGALVGALAWIAIAWVRDIPASPTHALLGGLVGAALAQSGPAPVHGTGVLLVLVIALAAPVIALFMTGLLLVTVSRVAFRAPPRRATRLIRRLQWVTSAAASVGHGGNGAQKALGIVWLAAIGAGTASPEQIGGWTAFGCHAAIAAGTFVGGVQAVRRMAQRFTRLDPTAGLCVDAALGAVLIGSTALGGPVSTTHALAGSMLGASSTGRGRALDLAAARATALAWLTTLAAAGVLGALACALARRIA